MTLHVSPDLLEDLTLRIANAHMAPALKEACWFALAHTERDAQGVSFCAFDLATWARALGVRRQNLWRTREALVTLGILRYETCEVGAEWSARLVWSLNATDWTPLTEQYRRARYHRAGAGRKRIVTNLHTARAGRLSGTLWKRLRAAVFARDHYTCRYCGVQVENPHCDHVIPVARGGSNHLDNLVTACPACNLSKHAMTLEAWAEWTKKKTTEQRP